MQRMHCQATLTHMALPQHKQFSMWDCHRSSCGMGQLHQWLHANCSAPALSSMKGCMQYQHDAQSNSPDMLPAHLTAIDRTLCLLPIAKLSCQNYKFTRGLAQAAAWPSAKHQRRNHRTLAACPLPQSQGARTVVWHVRCEP